eukprot:jgi/Orpsp1_1/1191226/evm.model.d7180000084227.1
MMKGLCYIDDEKIEIKEFPLPDIEQDTDAIVTVTYASICSSDIHIVKGKVPRAKKGIILGHEGVGIIKKVGKSVKNFKVGDHVSINCITFCGHCYFCKKGYINNCSNGGWEVGCRINGTLAEHVRIPLADCSLNLIPNANENDISDKDYLFVGDALSSGYFGIDLGQVQKDDIVGVIGCGPVGLCTLICGKMKGAKLIAFDIDDECLDFAQKNNFADYYFNPKKFKSDEELLKELEAICGEQKGCDCTVEVAGSDESFQTAWKITRPNGIVSIVAMYEKNQEFPLPLMYGKNLIFKTGGVDAVKCDYLIDLIKTKKISTNKLITHEFKFEDILKGFELFRYKPEHCVKIAIKL